MTMTKQELDAIALKIIEWSADRQMWTPSDDEAIGVCTGVHEALEWLDKHGMLKG